MGRTAICQHPLQCPVPLGRGAADLPLVWGCSKACTTIYSTLDSYRLGPIGWFATSTGCVSHCCKHPRCAHDPPDCYSDLCCAVLCWAEHPPAGQSPCCCSVADLRRFCPVAVAPCGASHQSCFHLHRVTQRRSPAQQSYFSSVRDDTFSTCPKLCVVPAWAASCTRLNRQTP